MKIRSSLIWMVRVPVITFIFTVAPASAEEHLRDVTWSSERSIGEMTDDGWLRLGSTSEGGLTVELARIVEPEITEHRYFLRGRIRYQKVEGEGYLEMWSVFPDGNRYFTRTLLDAGPLARIEGSSEGRDFALFFDASGATAPPEELVVNLVLPGRGEVSLSPMALVQLAGEEAFPLGAAGAPSSVGLVGGLAGAGVGVFCGVLGLLGGLGRARSFVLSGFTLIGLGGGGALIFAAVQYFRGSSGDVLYPLTLIGAVSLVVSATLIPFLGRRYQASELRRLRALDAS